MNIADVKSEISKKLADLAPRNFAELEQALHEQMDAEKQKNEYGWGERVDRIPVTLDLSEMLVRLFDWSNSIKGVDYWNAVYRQVELAEMQQGSASGFKDEALLADTLVAEANDLLTQEEKASQSPETQNAEET